MSGDIHCHSPLEGLSAIESSGPEISPLGRMLVDNGVKVRKIKQGSNVKPKSELLDCYSEAFDRGKVGIDGEGLLDRLSGNDILIWSGYLAWPGGLEISELLDKYPKLVVVHLTPFGATGPMAQRPSSDLVQAAMSGYLQLTGSRDRKPVKPSVPYNSERLAGVHGFAALMLAMRRRRITGKGSYIDLSIRDAALWNLTNAYQLWDMDRINLARSGSHYTIGDMSMSLPQRFECLDGYIVWMPMAGRNARGSISLVKRMEAAKEAPPQLINFDWPNLHFTSQHEIEQFLAPFCSYFKKRTAENLFADAVVDGTLMAPVRNFEGVVNDIQLAARNNWVVDKVSGEVLPARPVRISNSQWPSRA